MVKLGGVRNYIVGTWNASDLEACAAMNLPCADLSPWLPEPMDNEAGAGGFGTHDYLVSKWACAWQLPLDGSSRGQECDAEACLAASGAIGW